MKAMQDDGTMLCNAVLTREDYEDKVRTMSEEIASANYQQQPIDLKGRLYSSFKTYTDIPRDANGKPLFTHIRSYTDTADTGADYLCSIIYGEYNHEAYVLDIYYTKASMEITEPETARRLAATWRQPCRKSRATTAAAALPATCRSSFGGSAPTAAVWSGSTRARTRSRVSSRTQRGCRITFTTP